MNLSVRQVNVGKFFAVSVFFCLFSGDLILHLLPPSRETRGKKTEGARGNKKRGEGGYERNLADREREANRERSTRERCRESAREREIRESREEEDEKSREREREGRG
ncbi:hypothetical protein DPMN_152887 [Dreissena polymorpha]|uniref:Uncharacterized protein n=1 Tax=Dreissena polymorpha TaxID=45954 RepID=A0A9D4J4A1_DREPO|nr:hypothetical protein DPMN_152887 [Dreissena polymorpha]